jgi:hypothetical protein
MSSPPQPRLAVASCGCHARTSPSRHATSSDARQTTCSACPIHPVTTQGRRRFADFKLCPIDSVRSRSRVRGDLHAYVLVLETRATRASRQRKVSLASDVRSRRRYQQAGPSSISRTWSEEAVIGLKQHQPKKEEKVPSDDPKIERPPNASRLDVGPSSPHLLPALPTADPSARPGALVDQASALIHEGTELVASAARRAHKAESRATHAEAQATALRLQLADSDAALEAAAEELLALHSALDRAERRRSAAEQRAGMLGIIVGSIFAALSERIARASWVTY